MKLTLGDLVGMLAKANDLFNLYYSLGMYSRAKRYADIGNRIIKCIWNPVNHMM